MQDNLPQTKNMRNIIPIKEIRRGIVLTGSAAIKFIEVYPVNFSLKSEREQNYIIDRYEELLKIIKSPFYMFTIAKKADSKAHIDFMQKHYDTEGDENVKKMNEEYIRNLKEISHQNAVRRRFIVAFTYQVPPSFKFENIPFSDIESSLVQKSTQFKDAISKCGNEVAVILPKDEDRFAAQILFEILNIKSSEKERVVNLLVN